MTFPAIYTSSVTLEETPICLFLFPLKITLQKKCFELISSDLSSTSVKVIIQLFGRFYYLLLSTVISKLKSNMNDQSDLDSSNIHSAQFSFSLSIL